VTSAMPGAIGGRGAGRRRAARRSRASGLALAASLALVVVAPAIGLAPSSPVDAATTDLTLVTSAVYDVRPASGLIHVTVSVVAKNNVPDTAARTFYFDSGYLVLPPAVSNLQIAGVNGAKGATVVTTKKASTATTVRVGFGGHLYSGTSRSFTLEFDLRDAGGDATRPLRITSSLAAFPVWAFASTGATGSTVSVTFPAGYTVNVETGAFAGSEPTADGGTRLFTKPLATPLTFYAYVLGERPPDVADTPLGLIIGGGSVSLTLRAWADDPGWSSRVGDLLTLALPALSTEVGLPWPSSAPRVIAESVNRTTGGNAGVFDPVNGRIEIAYWADPLVTIHEAAHGWFNGSLVADRWVAEGFAALYAGRVATELKVAGTSPALTDEVAKARIPLNEWAAANATIDKATETYGFAASLAVAQAIATAVGDEGLRAVWADAAAHVEAYQPPVTEVGFSPAGDVQISAPEVTSSPPDWRALLDLIEDRTGKDLSDLWRTWVVNDAQVTLLDARTQARAAYARTLALADGWALPKSIRDALRSWQFDRAEALLVDARAVLAQRASVETRAAHMGLTPPTAMRRLFEAGGIGAASTEATAENDVMLAIRTATAARPADPDVLTRIGLIGQDPDLDLGAARAAFTAGSLRQAETSAGAAAATWGGAWQEGRRRAVIAVALAAGLLVLASWIRGVRRRAGGHTRPAPRRRTRPA
jgi:hypothetical protein